MFESGLIVTDPRHQLMARTHRIVVSDAPQSAVYAIIRTIIDNFEHYILKFKISYFVLIVH